MENCRGEGEEGVKGNGRRGGREVVRGSVLWECALVSQNHPELVEVKITRVVDLSFSRTHMHITAFLHFPPKDSSEVTAAQASSLMPMYQPSDVHSRSSAPNLFLPVAILHLAQKVSPVTRLCSGHLPVYSACVIVLHEQIYIRQCEYTQDILLLFSTSGLSVAC